MSAIELTKNLWCTDVLDLEQKQNFFNIVDKKHSTPTAHRRPNLIESEIRTVRNLLTQVLVFGRGVAGTFI